MGKFPNNLETFQTIWKNFQTVWKVLRQSENRLNIFNIIPKLSWQTLNLSDNLETFQLTLKFSIQFGKFPEKLKNSSKSLILSKNFPDKLEAFQTIWKTFQTIWKNIQTNWKVSRQIDNCLKFFNFTWKLSRKTLNFSYKLETFQITWKLSRQSGKLSSQSGKFPDRV